LQLETRLVEPDSATFPLKSPLAVSVETATLKLDGGGEHTEWTRSTDIYGGAGSNERAANDEAKWRARVERAEAAPGK
jgi:hypothetical protein